MNFNKHPITLTDQLTHLESRGLSFPEKAKAISHLTNLGYYRLSGYSLPFRKGPERTHFKDGTTINQIIRVYDFDRQLRLLVNDAVERIEIGIRSRMVTDCSLHYQTSHWFSDPSNFHTQFNHRRFLKKTERSLEITYDQTTGNRVLPTTHPETFIEHYYQTYTQPYLPPFWMVAEIMTLGGLSHLFKGLGDPALKVQIAQPFGVSARVFVSWLHAVSHFRNVCAHHGRLWNRVFSISPTVARSRSGQINSPQRFEGHAATLLLLLDECSPGHSWRQRFMDLFAQYPEINETSMGFAPNWKTSPIWTL